MNILGLISQLIGIKTLKLTQLNLETQAYGPWLRGDLPRFQHRETPEWETPRAFSSSERRGETAPVGKAGTDAQNKAIKETPKVTPPPRMVMENLDFQVKLKEIDRELGLEHGEINESLEILLQGDPYFKFQIPKAGELSHENSNAGLETCESNGPQSFGHIVDSSGPQRQKKKPSGSTWKKVTRNVMGPTSSTHQPFLAQQKRSQAALLEEESVRSFRKTKAGEEASITSEVQISAEVAMQPRRTQ